MNAIGTPRWSIQSQSWVDAETLAGPVEAESLDTLDAGPAVHSDEVLRLTGQDPGRSPQSECKHDMFVYHGESFCHWCKLKLERPEP